MRRSTSQEESSTLCDQSHPLNGNLQHRSTNYIPDMSPSRASKLPPKGEESPPPRPLAKSVGASVASDAWAAVSLEDEVEANRAAEEVRACDWSHGVQDFH
jgi:hypothetical protein